MENFIVSARKYRPLRFNAVVGQGHVTGTLKNAIKNNQLAQAFLFCGPRGVGKTTCARILAKTINCQNITSEFEACDECESCLSFRKGASLNIHELDAASNNSVDDIRSLVEQVRYPPQSGKYKIYIIDEVHMLSQSAFNAFLKTLEEPPSYAIFILATTEKHKIIPTILSRCQIFDFNRIKVEDITRHLTYIAEEEKISFENDGLHLIARKSDGALRDALSMFDQIVSFSGGNLSYKAVIDNLNILDYDYYFRLTRFLLDEDIAGSLLVFDEILGKGFDGNNFINGLCAHFRDLLVCKEEKTVELLEVSEGIRQRYLEQSGEASAGFLLSALNIGNQCDINYRLSKNPRLQVELTLMKMCHINAVIKPGSGAAPVSLPDGEVKKKRVTEAGKQPKGENTVRAGAAAETTPERTGTGIGSPLPSPEEASPGSTGKTSPRSTERTSTGSPEKTSPDSTEKPSTGSPESIPTSSPESASPEKISPGSTKKTRPTALPKSENPFAPRKISSSEMVIPSLAASPEVKDEKEAPPAGAGKAGSRENLPSAPFTEPQLLTYWEQYAAKMEASGRHNMYTLMTTFSPVLHDNFMVELKVVNKVQQEKFQDEKQDIMQFLRKKLDNYQLEITPVLHEGEDNRRRLYTSTDKFNYLAEKNPSLIELRKRLDLDIDF